MAIINLVSETVDVSRFERNQSFAPNPRRNGPAIKIVEETRRFVTDGIVYEESRKARHLVGTKDTRVENYPTRALGDYVRETQETIIYKPLSN